tara:strand:- start:288 stop:440 length:153 start_codon:yes stop_codon:yes gene_type:complete
MIRLKKLTTTRVNCKKDNINTFCPTPLLFLKSLIEIAQSKNENINPRINE